jgi:hypothetical protein
MGPPRTYHTIETLKARTIDEGDCWLWQGYIQNGTPQVMHYRQNKKGMYSVRRLLRELQVGRAMPDGHYGNTCGNPQCVSPDHTLWKNTKSHMRDMANRRTHGPLDSMKKRQARIDRGLTKLDMEKAQAIRNSDEPGRVLAAQYGVHESMIKRIRTGRVWKVLSSPFAGLLK